MSTVHMRMNTSGDNVILVMGDPKLSNPSHIQDLPAFRMRFCRGNLSLWLNATSLRTFQTRKPLSSDDSHAMDASLTAYICADPPRSILQRKYMQQMACVNCWSVGLVDNRNLFEIDVMSSVFVFVGGLREKEFRP